MNLGTSCEACNQQFCAEHLVLLFGMKLCPACAADAWAQMPEPDCQCIQTDVDLFSVRDCPIHNPCSDWNQLRRTMT